MWETETVHRQQVNGGVHDQLVTPGLTGCRLLMIPYFLSPIVAGLLSSMTQEVGLMHIETTVSQISPHRRRLVELMRSINFGTISTLHVRNGEPDLDHDSTVTREIKFGGEREPRTVRCADFVLKDQVIELFDQLDHVRDGIVHTLEIKYGLPYRMMLTSTCR